MITAIYRYERFDPAVNKELWRRIPGWKLRLMWLRDWLNNDRPARIGFTQGCHCHVAGGGEWSTFEMLDFNQEAINGR